MGIGFPRGTNIVTLGLDTGIAVGFAALGFIADAAVEVGLVPRFSPEGFEAMRMRVVDQFCN